MRRRDFLRLLGGAAAASSALWPLDAVGQGEAVRRIVMLPGMAKDDQEGQARVAAFQQGLRDLGWNDGRNIRIDFRWGSGDAEVIRRLAKEAVGLKPDLIVGVTTPVLSALTQETRTRPQSSAKAT